MRPVLNWPREAALPTGEKTAELVSPPSNLVLDLHGDPAAANLHVFSDGNHHMALADTMAAFATAHPDVGDIFYATTPPRIIIDALSTGSIDIGNVRIATNPHVFICPGDVLERVTSMGHVTNHRPFMESQGTALLFTKDNPKQVMTVHDLLRSDVRLAISHPLNETASFEVYERIITALGEDGAWSKEAIAAFLRSDEAVKSQIIHHREVPELIASGAADASVVYYHLALRYKRIFPQFFDCERIAMQTFDPQIVTDTTTTYHVGIVGDGGAFGAAFEDFLFGEEVTDIYRHHGLDRPSA